MATVAGESQDLFLNFVKLLLPIFSLNLIEVKSFDYY